MKILIVLYAIVAISGIFYLGYKMHDGAEKINKPTLGDLYAYYWGEIVLYASLVAMGISVGNLIWG